MSEPLAISMAIEWEVHSFLKCSSKTEAIILEEGEYKDWE